jgi:hypothetical protein
MSQSFASKDVFETQELVFGGIGVLAQCDLNQKSS